MNWIFCMHMYPKEQPSDSKIYIESTQKCPDTLKSKHKELSESEVCIIYLKS